MKFISDQEIEIQKQITEQFIAADPSTILINRPHKVFTPDGGYTYENAASRDPQVVRVIAQTDNEEKRASDGTLVVSDLVVLGRDDFDCLIGDTFDWRFKKWRVVSIDSSPQYVRKAEAVLA